MTERKPEFRHRNLPLLLLQARETVIARFRPTLNAAGVTEQQWRVVRELVEHGPLEPRQIVGRCGISSPSLAGVLARMEDAGWITRERLGHDQRRVKVTPTAASRALARRIAGEIEATYAAIEACVGAEFTTCLYTMLDTLITTLGRGASDAAAERPGRAP